jgi:DNA-binding MurR/RpiR family transcriptional regulator
MLRAVKIAISLHFMEYNAFVAKVKQVFDELPGQIRVAAGFVLDNPQEVALLSMREQARRAGVPPATMTRFAQHLGFAGYDEVKAIHADAIRETPEAYSGRAKTLVARHREVGPTGVATEMATGLAAHLGDMSAPSRIAAMVAAAEELAAARRIFALGQR